MCKLVLAKCRNRSKHRIKVAVGWSNRGRSQPQVISGTLPLGDYEQIWAADKDANAKEAATKVAMVEITGER